MTTKKELYRLIDRLPEEAIPEMERFLEALTGPGDQGLPRFLAEAPWDDELETDEERAAAAEGHEALRRGDTVSAEEITREFGV